MKLKKFNSALFGPFFILILYAMVFPQNHDGYKQYLSKERTENLVRVGNWPFGAALAVAVDTTRQLVYLGSGGAVLVLDVSDLSQPHLVSDIINTKGLVKDLRYNHLTQHLYVAANYEDFQIWDMQDPAVPVQLCQYGFQTWNVDLYLNYAITDGGFYVNSIDVSDPQNPVSVDADASMGYATDIHVASDGRLHSTGDDAYVKIYIDTDGSLTGEYFFDILGGTNRVFGVSEAAFVRNGDNLVIVNTQSHLHPIWSITPIGFFSDIFVYGSYAYFTVDDRLEIYNVTSYSGPYQEGSCTVPGYPEKLEVIDSIAYLAGGYSGLRNINVKSPSQPFETGFYETFSATRDMVRSGDYAFITELDDGMLVLDLSDISSPTLVSQHNTPGHSVALEVAGNLAYIADAEGGLRIADISNPLNPTEVSSFDSLSYAFEVCISGTYAYVVDDIINQPDWIKVIDISNPANPNQVGEILMQSNIDALDAQGNYLYAAAADQGMRVLDISDPTNPVEVGWFLAPNVYDIRVRSDYAYIASSDPNGGFLILDISDPLNPELISSYGTGWLHPFDVSIEGDYAYVGDPVSDEILLLFVGDPAHPSEHGSFKMSGDVYELFALDSLVYVSDGVAGLHIFENKLFSTPGAGITWQPQFSGTTEDLWSTHFANSTIGWAAGSNGMIVKTTDGGQTWLPKTSGTASELFTVFFIDATTGWAAGQDGTIIKSTDGGESWQPLVSGTTNALRSIHFTDMNNGWVAGQNGTILHTQDGGNIWQPQMSGINSYLRSINFADALHGWVAVHNGIILKTTDGGTNWNTINLPTSKDIYDIYFLNQNLGWAATSDVEVFKSIDGGNTWVEQYHNPQSPYDVITSIYFVDEDYGWAVGYNGRVISTTNGGANWVEETSGVQEYLTSVYFADPFTGWTVGKSGTILKAASTVTSIGNRDLAEENLPNEVVLDNNYPNPFNPTTTIQYELPKRSRVTLKIYDILGKEIKTLVNGVQSQGLQSAIWDGRNLQGAQVSSGIYIYRLKTEEAILSKKMILIR